MDSITLIDIYSFKFKMIRMLINYFYNGYAVFIKIRVK